MTASRNFHNADEEGLHPAALRALQRHKLAALLAEVRDRNPFYREKLSAVRFDPLADPLDRLPFTTRAELEAGQLAAPPFGTNLTYPLDRYCRFHQTSGTGGRAMRWLDTAESWDWFKRCWGVIFAAAGVGPGDRLMFPFSFGPFVGFWAAFEGAVAMGRMAIPAGGLSTTARLKMVVENEVNVVCCTPTYALRMAEVAAQEGVDLAGSAVRAIIVAGEPGGSIPATRARIESAWGARVFDHTGMTEMGAMSFECAERPGEGVHVIENEFIPEVIDPKSGNVLPDDAPGGVSGELVLTNLGRLGSPLIRYRTGDHVRLTRQPCACGRWFARLEGGILGRTDDMFIVRGNNVFPPAVEAVVRRFPEVAEFRATVREDGALTQVRIEIEPHLRPDEGSPMAWVETRMLVDRIGRALQEALHFRADVAAVPHGTLPRPEMKARRFVRVNGKTID